MFLAIVILYLQQQCILGFKFFLKLLDAVFIFYRLQLRFFELVPRLLVLLVTLIQLEVKTLNFTFQFYLLRFCLEFYVGNDFVLITFQLFQFFCFFLFSEASPLLPVARLVLLSAQLVLDSIVSTFKSLELVF